MQYGREYSGRRCLFRQFLTNQGITKAQRLHRVLFYCRVSAKAVSVSAGISDSSELSAQLV